MQVGASKNPYVIVANSPKSPQNPSFPRSGFPPSGSARLPFSGRACAASQQHARACCCCCGCARASLPPLASI